MAKAKTKKSVKKSKKTPQPHEEQVRTLGRALITVIEKGKFHPIVALDALQILLSAGIASALGEKHQEIWDNAVHAYHEESKMLSILEMFQGMNLQRLDDEAPTAEEPVADTKSPYYRAGGGPADESEK